MGESRECVQKPRMSSEISWPLLRILDQDHECETAGTSLWNTELRIKKQVGKVERDFKILCCGNSGLAWLESTL